MEIAPRQPAFHCKYEGEYFCPRPQELKLNDRLLGVKSEALPEWTNSGKAQTLVIGAGQRPVLAQWAPKALHSGPLSPQVVQK